MNHMARKDIIERTTGNKEAIQHLVAALDRMETASKGNRARRTYNHEAVMNSIKESIVELVVIDIPEITMEEIDILTQPSVLPRHS